MPKLLVIDTSASICGVGLSASGMWRQLQTETPRQAAQEVLSLVEAIFKQSDITLSQLDAIVIASGPGSFTGLRIGIGIVQGLAEASVLPVISVSNLALGAFTHLKNQSAETAVVSFSAREEESYWAVYQKCHKLGVKLQGIEKVIRREDQFDALRDIQDMNDCILVGDGWDEKLLAIYSNQTSSTFANIKVNLRDMCEIAEKRLDSELWLKPEQLAPNYVKEELDYLS